MELSEYQKNNIKIVVFKRPFTMLQQYQLALTTDKRWILFLDNDSELISIPDIDIIPNDIDLVSFLWVNAPLVFGSDKYTTSNCLVRTSSLIEVLQNNNKLSSVGLDLYLQSHLIVQYNKDGIIKHNSKVSMKKFYRYGKGRGYYAKTSDCNLTPNVHYLYFRYIHLYIAYLIGYMIGIIKPRVDENW